MKIVIFAGGYGTRMWPASRKSFPKQFYPIVKGRSFFQNTVARFEKRVKPEDIFVSTEASYARFINEQAPELPKENLILEPERRDSLGAIGLAAAVIEKRFPGEVVFFSWSDHFVGNEEEFLDGVETAANYCKETGRPVSINEKPTFASIHNGWLEIGKEVANENGYPIFMIEKHVEKPDVATAETYLKAGNYLIHTGYGAWRSDLLLSYFKEYRPSEYQGLLKIMDAWGTENQGDVLRNEYRNFEKISVEYGLFEKLPHDLRVTLAVNTGWEDAGTWQLFYKAMLEAGQENVLEGGVEAEFQESTGNLLVGRRGKLISIIGLNNLVVIDTDDALLIAPMDKTDKVKEMFKKLEEEKPRYVD